MQDPVADVLQQRAAMDTSAVAGVILSFLLHGSLAYAAFYAARHAKAPQVAGVLNIKFAPMPAVAPLVSAPKAAAAPKPAAPKIEPPKPEPVKKVEDKKPVEKNTVPFSPFGKSKQKGSEHPAPPPPKTPSVTSNQQPATTAAGAASVQPGVSAALEGGDFPYTMYLDRMKSRIGANWLRPSGDAVVVVYFAIDRDGTIRDARVETSSGSGLVDRAALRAVLESSPLPPLPFGYNGTYLGVHLTFR